MPTASVAAADKSTVSAAAATAATTAPTSTAPTTSTPTATGTIPVGRPWHDTDGNHIQAHGGGFLQHDGWYYWVGENKSHNGARFNGVSLYRSSDLTSWTYVKDILTPESAPELADCKVERPKLLYNEATETFVLWGHWETADSYAASHLVVATSKTIDGDYEFVRHFRPGAGEVSTPDEDPTYPGDDGLWGYGSRDLTVFQDPDSHEAYLVSSQNHLSMRVYPLTADYTGVDWENSYPLFEGERREAPALAKAGNRYYLFTSSQSGWYPNQAMYAFTDDISDPNGWSELRPVGNNTTFYSQPTNIMAVDATDRGRTYVYMGDRWNPRALGSSTYVWLPLTFGGADGTDVSMDFHPQWSIDPVTGTIDVPPGEEVAQGKPVEAAQADPAYPPAAANDGNPFNLNSSGDNTNYYLPPDVPFSWTVDLGSERRLSRIDIAFRSYNGSETYSAYTVSGSDDGRAWTRLVDASANTTVGFTSDPLSESHRYVRVDVSSVINDHNGNPAAWAAGLVEVQVYADTGAG